MGPINEGAYIRGGGVKQTKKKCFETSLIAELIKILFEFDHFFELQNVVKSRIHFNTSYRTRLSPDVFFFGVVDGPIN